MMADIIQDVAPILELSQQDAVVALIVLVGLMIGGLYIMFLIFSKMAAVAADDGPAAMTFEQALQLVTANQQPILTLAEKIETSNRLREKELERHRADIGALTAQADANVSRLGQAIEDTRTAFDKRATQIIGELVAIKDAQTALQTTLNTHNTDAVTRYQLTLNRLAEVTQSVAKALDAKDNMIQSPMNVQSKEELNNAVSQP